MKDGPPCDGDDRRRYAVTPGQVGIGRGEATDPESGGSLSGVLVSLCVLLCLLVMPVAGGAQGGPALVELAPNLSLGDTRPDAVATSDHGGSPPRGSGEPRRFTVEEVIGPIPLTSSVTLEPTYGQRANGTFSAYINVKGILVIESGLPLVSRIEWPIPEVDDENGPTNAGIGDLAWLTLFVVGNRTSWGTLGMGPVFVFPTASHSAMGQGTYQLGPALGYVNDGLPGWHVAFLLQQYVSFAGDPRRSSVNQLTLQPFVTRLLPDSWYVQTQPVITLDFARGTSSVPLNLVVGKLFAGRWHTNVQATVYPRWTSPPSTDYELRLSVGYHLPALLSKP
jgi:hypothetical protein